MFTSKDFAVSLVSLFGSKIERVTLMREQLEGSLAFAYFHAVGHGNLTPLAQLGEKVATGTGLRKAVREFLAGARVPRLDIPADKAVRAEFLRTVEKAAEDFALSAGAAIGAAWEAEKAEKADKREAEKAEKEVADAKAAAAEREEERERVRRALNEQFRMCIIGSDGEPVTLTEKEFGLLTEFLGTLRAAPAEAPAEAPAKTRKLRRAA